MSFLPLLLRALPYLLCVALGAYGAHRWDAGTEAELRGKLSAITAASKQADADAAQNIRDIARQYQAAFTTMKGVLDATVKANAAAHAADAERVRQYDAYRAAHAAVARTAGGPRAAAEGTSGGTENDDSLATLGSVAIELADAGRDVTAALTACKVERDALTGKP